MRNYINVLFLLHVILAFFEFKSARNIIFKVFQLLNFSKFIKFFVFVFVFVFVFGREG